MGSLKRVSDQLKQRLRNERERHGLSQAAVCELMAKRGISVYPSTIAKIESGERTVHTEELIAFADMFGVSVDALLDRKSGGTDVVWAVSKLTSTAQKTASDIRALHDRIDIDLADVRYYATDGEAADIMERTGETLAQLRSAEVMLGELAAQFPLPK